MKSLNRFVEAQHESYERALSEIKSGSKQSHWMWYIFPQLEGLGRTDIARLYGIEDLDEATNYLNHPVLGSRLVEISQALLNLESNDARTIMGKPDDRKLRSCMTLFKHVEGSSKVFQEVLEKFFDGEEDELTNKLIAGEQI